jgi:hypothetical protein
MAVWLVFIMEAFVFFCGFQLKYFALSVVQNFAKMQCPGALL